MKKYLMTGVAALALCAGFTSCSHDEDFEPITQDQIDKAKYDQAFLAYVGGKIASNQDWGFSATPAASRFTRAKADYYGIKGDMRPMVVTGQNNGVPVYREYTFPSDCAASMFLAPEGLQSYQAVADAANAGGGFATGVCYIDEGYKGKVHIWGGNERAKLYFKAGNYDFTNREFDLCQNADLYLLEGATLTLPNSAATTAKFDIYIANGATLIANGDGGLKLDNGAKLYNHGNVEATTLQTNMGALVYNVGTIETVGGIYATSVGNNSVTDVIVNDGTITSGTRENPIGVLNTAGSTAIQNNAEWTVYGNTIIDSNNNVWVNNGHFITNDFCYTAASEAVINNCKLEVKNNFNINLGGGSGAAGSFKNSNGSGVIATNFNGGGTFSTTYVDASGTSQTKTHNGGPFGISMGSGSVFKVTGTATMTGNNPFNGFFGTGDDYAVLEANRIVAGNPGKQGQVTYSGKLYVVANEHFAKGYDGQVDRPYIYIDNGFVIEDNIYAPGSDFKPGKPSISITSNACNPGFEGYVPLEKAIRIIAEDLSASGDTDFDFNDIVLDVEFSSTNAVLTLQAAGGTLPLRIDGKDEWEVHKLFGVDVDYMVNTNAKKLNRKGNLRDIEPITFSLGRAIKNAAEANGIKLEVYKNNVWQTLTAEKGEPACKLAVGLDFNWLDERTSIKDEYEKFVDWANGTEFVSKWWR